MKGGRQFRLEISKKLCTFDELSSIEFFNEKEELILSLDPTDISLIYGAYRQMEKEMAEEKNNEH